MRSFAQAWLNVFDPRNVDILIDSADGRASECSARCNYFVIVSFTESVSCPSR